MHPLQLLKISLFLIDIHKVGYEVHLYGFIMFILLAYRFIEFLGSVAYGFHLLWKNFSYYFLKYSSLSPFFLLALQLFSYKTA
jgi:hypothetical protein